MLQFVIRMIQGKTSLSEKKALSWALVFLILCTGIIYQWQYHRREIYYRQVITGYYWKYFNRAPDPIGLTHWVTWALNKGGLKKIEKMGFVDAKAKGAT